jgi:predicted Zn-dependent peptidase
MSQHFKPLGSYVINKKRVYNYEHKNNGLRVTLVPLPSTTVAVNVVNKFGSASEKIKAKSGSLHLLEHLYFRIGKLNKNISNSAFALSVKTGAYQNAQTTASSMDLICHSHAKYQDDVLKLFSERMQDNFIDPAAKEVEEQAVFNEAQRSLKSPYMQIITRLSQTAMGSSGYSWMTIGTIEDVNNVTAQQLMDLKKHFSKPDNAHIVVSGAVSDTLELVHKHFGAMKRSSTPVERPGLKPAEPQLTMKQDVVEIDAQFPVIALGFRSPHRQPFGFTNDDVMLRVIAKAVERPEIQSVLQQQGFVRTSVFNPEYVAPYLFSFLSCPQSDPSHFPQSIQAAVGAIKALPSDEFRNIVKDLKYDMESSMTSAHAATELLADTVSTKKFDTLKQIHSAYCKMIKSDNIQSTVQEFADRYFDFSQSTFIIGVPKAQVNAMVKPPAPRLLPKIQLDMKSALPKSMGAASKVAVVESNHNYAIVQHGSPDVYVNISVPFQSDVRLQQEATHTLLADLLNSVPLSNAAASTRRSYSTGHDVFHISMKMKSASGLADILQQLKSPDFSNFNNVRVSAASMARGESLNATSVAKVAAINSVYQQSPFLNYHTLPDKIQDTTLQQVQDAHANIMQNMNTAYFTFTGDWSSENVAAYKAKLQQLIAADFSPISGIARMKGTGERVNVGQYTPHTNSYTIISENNAVPSRRANAAQRSIPSHMLTKNTVVPFQWVPKQAAKGWKTKSLGAIASATIMYAVSFPKDKLNAMEHFINMMGDSMSGFTMQRVRWQNGRQCYGINGQTVSTNATSSPLAVVIGTVGMSALENAKVDMQQVFAEHVGRVTQDQLDVTHERMCGERNVKTDYAGDIHGLVHANLVAGKNPTLAIEKPSLRDVNEVSRYILQCGKVEVLPSDAPSAVGTQTAAAAAAMIDVDEDEDSDIEFYL